MTDNDTFREVMGRVTAVADDLHRAANAYRPTVEDLKREIRDARNALRQLVEEFSI